MVVMIGGLTGMIVGGGLSDKVFAWWVSIGRLAASGVGSFAGAAVILTLLSDSSQWMITAAGLWLFFSSIGGIGGVTAIQDAITSDARGLAISMIALGNITLGLSVGALLPPIVSDALYQGPRALNLSLITVSLPCVLLAAVLFLVTMRSERRP